jgi:drug/metabolite transporter (DMT)-like permease
LVWAAWIYFLSRAYSLAKASDIAPFEYMSLPINIVWGLIFWNEVPTLTTLAGAALTLFSGLYIWYRDRKVTG